MAILDILNGGNLNELADASARVTLGTLLGYAISKMSYTETAQAVTSNVRTLNNPAIAVFQVVATATGSTGVKKLRKGPITGISALTPAPGECVWDGASSILFNVADNVTACSTTYAVAADVASITKADLTPA